MSFTVGGPDPAREALVRANRRLLESGQGSDLTVMTKDGSKKYHSAIVCPRSSVLSAAYWGSFKEGVTKTIDLSEDDPLIVGKVMRYLYFLNYPGHGGIPSKELTLHAQMYVMGDKYDIPDLREVAARKFAEWCLDLSLPTAEHLAVPLLKSFQDVLPLAYKSVPETDDTLRRPIARVFKTHLTTFPHLVKNDEYRSYCLEYPLFGLDVQMAILLVPEEEASDSSNEYE